MRAGWKYQYVYERGKFERVSLMLVGTRQIRGSGSMLPHEISMPWPEINSGAFCFRILFLYLAGIKFGKIAIFL